MLQNTQDAQRFQCGHVQVQDMGVIIVEQLSIVKIFAVIFVVTITGPGTAKGQQCHQV
jgi:hypothetical protein